jgi:hypothetical protein
MGWIHAGTGGSAGDRNDQYTKKLTASGIVMPKRQDNDDIPAGIGQYRAMVSSLDNDEVYKFVKSIVPSIMNGTMDYSYVFNIIVNFFQHDIECWEMVDSGASFGCHITEAYFYRICGREKCVRSRDIDARKAANITKFVEKYDKFPLQGFRFFAAMEGAAISLTPDDIKAAMSPEISNLRYRYNGDCSVVAIIERAKYSLKGENLETFNSFYETIK